MSTGLQLRTQILVDMPARVFGLRRTSAKFYNERIPLLAPYLGSDGISYIKSSAQLSNFRVIGPAGCMIFQPTAGRRDTTLAMVNFPNGGSSDWSEQLDNTTGVTALVMNNAEWNTTFDVATNASLPANSTFTVRIGRGQAATPPTGSTLDGTNNYTVLRVGDSAGPDGSGATPFQLILQDGAPPFLQQGVDDGEGGWYWGQYGQNGIYAATIQDSSSLFEKNGRMLQIAWLPFPGQNVLAVDIDGIETMYFRIKNTEVSPGNGITRRYTQNLSVAEGALRLYGQNGDAHFQYLPVAFNPTAEMYSGEIDLDHPYQDIGFVDLGDSVIPDGYKVTWGIYPTDNTRMKVKYYLKIDSQQVDPVSISPIVTSIQMRIPAVTDYTATIGYSVDISDKVGEVAENQYVHFGEDGNVTIRTQVGVKFDNAYGDFSAFAGINRAVEYSRWLEYQANDGTMQPVSAPILYLTGWGGVEGSVTKADPLRDFDTVFYDNLYPLDVCQCEVQTPGDGWCYKAYQRFLALMQGRDDAFISDDFKTCQFGPNPPGCNHLKLPLGVGGIARVEPSPESSYLAAIEEINSFIFAVVWSDPAGVLQSQPYYPFVYNTPYKGAFGVSESGIPGHFDFLTSMWNRQKLRIDSRMRRTGVNFIGLDPAVNMIQETSLNVDDFIPGFVAGVHGFHQRFVKVSNLFVDPVFTEAYAFAALQRIILPTVIEEHDAAFLPNLFCLDRYSVIEDNEMVSGEIPLVVEQITSRYSTQNPNVFGSTVTGRWAYNLL